MPTFSANAYKNQSVTSIYDKMPFGKYEGLPLSFIFHFEPQYLEWCIREKPDFCIKEWDSLVELEHPTIKGYGKSKEKETAVYLYNQYSKDFSDDELLLVQGGGERATISQDVIQKNIEKLQKLGISPEAYKIPHRTYISSLWEPLPNLSGIWEFEGIGRTSKNHRFMSLVKTSESICSFSLINNRLGLIVDYGELVKVESKDIFQSFPEGHFEKGDFVEVKSGTYYEYGTDYEVEGTYRVRKN